MRLIAIYCLLLLFCSGCSINSRIYESMPEENYLTTLSSSETFAIHPDGETLAYVDNGLELLRLTDGYRQRLLFDAPEAIIWSADGRELVVALREAEQTRLVQLTADENNRPQVYVAEQVTDLAWLADGRLLAIGQQIEENGGELDVAVRLLIWDGGRDVERKPLYRFSYRKPLSTSGPFAEKLVQRFDLSPLKDEIVYSRHLGPPTPGAPLQQVLYNLHTGRERVLAEKSNQQLEAFLAADAEHVLLAQGADVALLNPWTEKAQFRWSGPGENISLAAGRELFLLDGRLFSGESLLLKLPADVKGTFSVDGSRLFVARGRKLYLFDGYPVPAEQQFSALEKVKLQNIRQQRSRGEIGLRDYYQAHNNILHP